MLFQHKRYVKALFISICRCICHISSIVLFFITLAKKDKHFQRTLFKEKMPWIYLIKKIGASVCLTTIRIVHLIKLIITICTDCSFFFFFFPNLGVYSTHIGISLNPASLKYRRLYCLLWQCDRSSRISTEENKLD